MKREGGKGAEEKGVKKKIRDRNREEEREGGGGGERYFLLSLGDLGFRLPLCGSVLRNRAFPPAWWDSLLFGLLSIPIRRDYVQVQGVKLS